MGKPDVVYTITSMSVQDQVYRQLYDLILNLELEPGSIISTNDISERLGVSRTPVREALELKNIGDFVRTATADDIDALKSIHRQMCNMMESGDLSGMIRYDNSFHQYMLKSCGQLLAQSIIANMNGHYARM